MMIVARGLLQKWSSSRGSSKSCVTAVMHIVERQLTKRIRKKTTRLAATTQNGRLAHHQTHKLVTLRTLVGLPRKIFLNLPRTRKLGARLSSFRGKNLLRMATLHYSV